MRLGLWLKIDASRRQNDPRKLEQVLVIMVRLRVSPAIKNERVSSEGLILLAKAPAGECGGKDQVS